MVYSDSVLDRRIRDPYNWRTTLLFISKKKAAKPAGTA
jgi:hypothetical protein